METQIRMKSVARAISIKNDEAIASRGEAVKDEFLRKVPDADKLIRDLFAYVGKEFPKVEGILDEMEQMANPSHHPLFNDVVRYVGLTYKA